MDITARGRIIRNGTGGLALQVEPNQSFALSPNELSKTLESLADTPAFVTVRGQLYKKPPGKKKPELPKSFTLIIVEVQKKE